MHMFFKTFYWVYHLHIHGIFLVDIFSIIQGSEYGLKCICIHNSCLRSVLNVGCVSNCKIFYLVYHLNIPSDFSC